MNNKKIFQTNFMELIRDLKFYLKQNKRLCKIDAEINEAHIKKKKSKKLTFLILRPAFFMAGNDIGKLTIKAIYDPRTSNKIVHFRPACMQTPKLE